MKTLEARQAKVLPIKMRHDGILFSGYSIVRMEGGVPIVTFVDGYGEYFRRMFPWFESNHVDDLIGIELDVVGIYITLTLIGVRYKSTQKVTYSETKRTIQVI